MMEGARSGRPNRHGNGVIGLPPRSLVQARVTTRIAHETSQRFVNICQVVGRI